MKVVEQEDEFEVKYIKYFVLTMAAALVIMVTYVVLTDDSDRYIEIKRQTRIANRIEKLRLNRSILYLDFDDKTKYWISSGTSNNTYTPPELISFATRSDWVEKKENSDTIKIMREGRGGKARYFIFVLGAELTNSEK